MLVRPACVRSVRPRGLGPALQATVLQAGFCKFAILLPMTLSQRVLIWGYLTRIITAQSLNDI